MRLPHRVPWKSVGEIEQLSAWIFTDDSDVLSKKLAIRRLSAWKAITSLPHALESTLTLLVVIVADEGQLFGQTSGTLSLRQSYATAVIRLVNGLVDPLQFGVYARSIASIAAQLGLPLWLVELRHAATHEDLPSIEILREAARQSMSWLFNNYFIPTITTSVTREFHLTLRPLSPLLKRYKGLMKIITRDASLRPRYKPKVASVMKDIERWIAEATVADNVAAGEIGWGKSRSTETTRDTDGDSAERYALQILCDGFLEKGALVPLSKKKREVSEDNSFPPKFSLKIWTPLLEHLQIAHSNFPFVLCDSIVSLLFTAEDLPQTLDPSFEMCLARWVAWTINAWDLDYHGALKKYVAAFMMENVGNHLDYAVPTRSGAAMLLQSICAGNDELQRAVESLRRASEPKKTWELNDIVEMSQRLEAFRTSTRISDSQQSYVSITGSSSNQTAVLPRGWRALREHAGWRPCPIGVYNTG